MYLNNDEDKMYVVSPHTLPSEIIRFLAELFCKQVEAVEVELANVVGVGCAHSLVTTCCVSPVGDKSPPDVIADGGPGDSDRQMPEQYTVQAGEYILPSVTISLPTISEAFSIILPLLDILCLTLLFRLLYVQQERNDRTDFHMQKQLDHLARMQTNTRLRIDVLFRDSSKFRKRMLDGLAAITTKLDARVVEEPALPSDTSISESETLDSTEIFDADEVLETSFSKDPRFVPFTLRSDFIGSKEHLSHISAWRLLKPLGFQLIAHECRIAGGDCKPDLVFERNGILFLMEAKHTKLAKARKQVTNTCHEFERLHDLHVVGLCHVTAGHIVAVHRQSMANEAFSPVGKNGIFRPQSGEYRRPATNFCSCCRYYEHIDNRIVYKCLPDCKNGFPYPVAEYKTQAGGRRRKPQSEDDSPTVSHLVKQVEETLSTKVIHNILSSHGVSRLEDLTCTELAQILRPDSNVNNTYKVYVDSHGVVFVDNPYEDSDATEIPGKFIEVTGMIPRTRYYPIVLDYNGDFISAQPKKVTRGLFNKICPYIPQALAYVGSRRGLRAATYEEFQKLDYTKQYCILADVFSYVRHSDSAGYRYLHNVLCGVGRFVDDRNEYLSAYIDDTCEYETPARKVFSPKGAKVVK